MAEGEFALVRQNLEIALDRSAQWVGEHDLYALLADAAAQQRDEAALRQYAPLAEEAAARYDHTLYRAIAQRSFGVMYCLAGDHAEAQARLQQALALFQELDARWQIGRTLFELGELAHAQLNGVAARNYLSNALATFEEIRATPDAARTQVMLERVWNDR